MDGKIGYAVLPVAVGSFLAFVTFTGFIAHGFLGVPSALLPFFVAAYPGFSFTNPLWIVIGMIAMFLFGWLYSLAFVFIYNNTAKLMSGKKRRGR